MTRASGQGGDEHPSEPLGQLPPERDLGRLGRFLVEPRRPDVIREHPKDYWMAVVAVCLGAFMGQLDASIVNLAYRPIEQSFHTSLGAATWVGLSYLLVLVASLAAAGKVADVFGRKLVYSYGFVVFVVGSGLCGVARDLPMLVGFRVLQALGAAMMQANSVAIIRLVMPPSKLGRGIGLQGAAQALGLALGPTIGGLLVAAGGWHLIFLVNVPVGVVGVVLARVLIPRSRDLADRAPFDWLGAGLLPPAVGCLLAALSLGDELGWASPTIISLFVVALCCSALLVRRERTTTSPLIEPRMFRQAAFSLGVASGTLTYLLTFGTLFAVPLFLTAGLGVSSSLAGLELTLMPIVLGIVAPAAGLLADRVGARPVTVTGMALTATSLALLAADGTSTAWRLAALALLGAGLGLFTPANNAAVMGSVPARDAGQAGGILNMSRGMGTAAGLAVTTLVFESIAGSSAPEGAHAVSGFRGASWCLAGVALAAGVLAALRSTGAGRLSPTVRSRASLEL